MRAARSGAGSSGCPVRAESRRPIEGPIKALTSCQILGLTASGAGVGGAGVGGAGTAGEGAAEAPGAGVGGGGVAAAGAAVAGVSGAGVAGASYDGEEAAAPWPVVIGVS